MSMLKNNEQKENEIKTKPWNEEDKQLLIELYPTHSNKELCKILQKTDGQLRGMKTKLGLNEKAKPFGDYYELYTDDGCYYKFTVYKGE